MIMCTIDHCEAKIRDEPYEGKFFFSTCGFATVGQPNLREVAHELIETIISMSPVNAKILFFIGDIFLIKRKKLDFSTQR